MYGKIFRQIYDSTLADDWRALVTFQQLIILCDDHGVVDMTAAAISRITNIPLDIIEPGLGKLIEPDLESRSKASEGRRIELIDQSRMWGWRLVNYDFYRHLVSKDDKREKDRQRLTEKRSAKSDVSLEVATCRSKSQPVAMCRNVSLEVANVAQEEEEAEEEAEAIKQPRASKPDALTGFDQFWIAYPKKKSKGQAEKTWQKIKPDEQLQDRIHRALEQAKTSVDWTKNSGQYVPHPATWLNAKGWEDEPITPGKPAHADIYRKAN